MVQEGNAAFQEVFAMASPAKSIKLLSWCISTTVPTCYISEALATTTQQGKGALATAVVPELEDSPAPGSPSSPACLASTPPSPAPLLPDLPFVGTPHGVPILQVHCWHLTEKVGPLPQWLTWWSSWQEDLCWFPRGGFRVNTVLHGAMKTCLNWYWRLDPALNNESRNLLALLPVQPGPLLILMMGQLQEAHGVLGIKPHWTPTHQGRMWLTPIQTQPLKTASCAQTQMRCLYELPARGTNGG